MKILFCTPEVYPFSKIGGVADFSASLPKSLSTYNNDIRVVSPFHKQVRKSYGDSVKLIGEKTITMGDKVQKASYYFLRYEEIDYYFIDNEYFNRKNIFGYDDDFFRFAFFNLAILEMLQVIDFYPNIIHLNDWTTSLLPYFLSSYYENDENYLNIKTLLTIHNLEKQGNFPKYYEDFFEKKNFTYLHLNDINFLKTGIMRSTRINTVSKSYRSEMMTKFFGFTLDGALKSRQFQLKGIQNALDFNLYNPETDENLFKNYNLNTYLEGKKVNKVKLLETVGFPDKTKPIVSFISRFAKEKGLPLIIEVIEEFLQNDSIYFFVIGDGDELYTEYFNELTLKYPKNVHYILGHNHNISQKFYAGSDILLMPSLYEASGLNQMIAMRYGTLPIVRETGGLKDTVIDYYKDKIEGTGFTFENFDEGEFKEAIINALELYNTDKPNWFRIIKNAMRIDNNIEKMAAEYQKLYEEVLND